jgi:hypothetical protein
MLLTVSRHVCLVPLGNRSTRVTRQRPRRREFRDCRVHHARNLRGDDPERTGSPTPHSSTILGSLDPGMLLLTDCGFSTYVLWCKVSHTGLRMSWRVTTGANGCARSRHSPGLALL